MNILGWLYLGEGKSWILFIFFLHLSCVTQIANNEQVLLIFGLGEEAEEVLRIAKQGLLLCIPSLNTCCPAQWGSKSFPMCTHVMKNFFGGDGPALGFYLQAGMNAIFWAILTQLIALASSLLCSIT